MSDAAAGIRRRCGRFDAMVHVPTCAATCGATNAPRRPAERSKHAWGPTPLKCRTRQTSIPTITTTVDPCEWSPEASGSAAASACQPAPAPFNARRGVHTQQRFQGPHSALPPISSSEQEEAPATVDLRRQRATTTIAVEETVRPPGTSTRGHRGNSPALVPQ
jgi:hypothetical protein